MKDKPANIYQRINLVMQEVDYIQKGDKKVNNQYRFVSHDQVARIMHGPLTKHGIVMLPSVTSTKNDGNRTEVMVNVRFVNCDDPEQFVSVDFLGFGIDSSDKGPGKAISYACKYALLKVFCLETGDDPDDDQEVVHSLSKSQLDEIKALLAQLPDAEHQKFIEWIASKGWTLYTVPADAYERLVSGIKKKLPAKEETHAA